MICIDKIIVGVVMEINLKNIMLCVGFLLWFTYILLYTVKELRKMHTLKTSYKTYLKNNIYKILRLDTLLIIIVFYLYTRFKNTTVDIYLFDVVIIYFLLNLLYEDISFKGLQFKKNWFYFLIIFLFSVILIGQYFISHKLLLTTMLMLTFIYFFPFIFCLLTIMFPKNASNK